MTADFRLAIDKVVRLKAVEHSWEDGAVVTQDTTRADDETATVFKALGAPLPRPIVSVSKPTAA